MYSRLTFTQCIRCTTRHWIEQFSFGGITVALLTVILSSPSQAQTVHTQSDWSGGAGEAGPVFEWENRFESSDGMAWCSIAGQIALSSIAVENPTQTVIVGDANEPSSVAAGDIDGDGRDDVIVTDPLYNLQKQLGAIYWWHYDEADNWTQHTVDDDFHGAGYAVTADVDLDGDLDVIAAAYYGVIDPPPPNGLPINGRFAWFENLNGDGLEWQKHLVGELFNGASHIDAADFDGDGDIDLVGASELTDGIFEQDADIVWFENLDGAGDNWAQHDIDNDFPNATEAHAADLDGDGDMDIVAAQYGLIPSQFHWWENIHGDATEWVHHLIPFPFLGAGFLDVGDIDNDGDLDLIGGGLNSGTIGFWQNIGGTGMNWQAWFVTTLPRGRTIQLADVDGDGDLDALAATSAPPQFGGAWWIENVDGGGFSWQLRTLDFLIPSLTPWIAAGDANHDGKLDALVCHYGGYDGVPTQQLSWWNLTEFNTSFEGELTSTILDGGDTPNWSTMAWDADVPIETDLTVQLRGSDDLENLGEFVIVPKSGAGLADLIDSQARYIQYRVQFTSNNPEQSPILRHIQVSEQVVGDLDGNGVVNTADLLLLLAQWGPCGDCNDCPADLNGDCTVSTSDLLLLLANWG